MGSTRNDPYQLTNTFTPREYQVELLDKARKNNVIVCLGTGTGKTFIAVMLIKELAVDIRHEYKENGKRTFFLVNNVPLVHQQATVIHDHTDLIVGEYQSNMNVDLWRQDEWDKHFVDNQVLVMTAQIFLDILNHGFFPLSKCNLLILDECHHAVKRHPMREIMRVFDNYAEESHPRILGLTASIIQKSIRPARLLKTIRELETTLRSTAETTSDLVNLSRYGTNPQEFLVEFKSANWDRFKSHKYSLQECKKFLGDYFYDKDDDMADVLPDPTKAPQNFITELLYTMQTMGPWCALKLTYLFIDEIEKIILSIPFPHYKLLLQISQTRIRVFQKELHNIINDDDSFEKLIEFSSPKVLRLLEILKSSYTEYMETETVVDDDNNTTVLSKSTICGIVFVERRHTARILHNYLDEVSRRTSEFPDIQSCFITGHSNGKANITHDSHMTFKKQEEVLRRFRMRECNIMIATSVVEEGLDLPKCNLVVRFDRPSQYRAYIQSKGRARQAGSKFILMVEDLESELFTKSLEDFHEIERILLHQCSDHALPTEEEIEVGFSDVLYPPYKPEEGEGKPQITISAAISLVNRYCAKLPSDTFTRLTARCKTETFSNESGLETFKCTMFLPINSPIKFPVEGKVESSRKLARMVVALETCKVLHQYGELDDHLLPLGKESIKIDESLSSDEDDDDDKVAGTTKRRRYYHKRIADPLKYSFPVAQEKSYLYVIEMKLTCPIPDEQNTRGRPVYDPAQSKRCFAILTNKSIPPLCGFPVFTRSGEVSVKIVQTPLDDPHFTSSQLEKLSYFHQYTFTNVLRLKKFPMEFSGNDAEGSYLVIPVICESENHCSVDWNFVDLIHNQKDEVNTKPNQNENFVFEEERYKDAVVMPCYRNLDQPQFFYVAEICRHLNPESDFPGNFNTFTEYFKKKYNADIKSLDQPLLDVDHTSARLNLLTPRYVNRKGVALPSSSDETKKSKRENLQQKQILVPELCLIHPFPASLWKKVVCLPSVLYRMNSILLAEQLRNIVARDLNIGSPEKVLEWPSLNFGWSLADAFKEPEITENTACDERKNNSNDEKDHDSVEESIHDSADEIGHDSVEESIHDSVDEMDHDSIEEINYDCVDSCKEIPVNKIAEFNEDDKLNIGVWSNDMEFKKNESNIQQKVANDSTSDDSMYDDFDDFDSLMDINNLEIMDPCNHFSFPMKNNHMFGTENGWVDGYANFNGPSASVGIISGPEALDANKLASDIANSISSPNITNLENKNENVLIDIQNKCVDKVPMDCSLPTSDLLLEDCQHDSEPNIYKDLDSDDSSEEEASLSTDFVSKQIKLENPSLNCNRNSLCKRFSVLRKDEKHQLYTDICENRFNGTTRTVTGIQKIDDLNVCNADILNVSSHSLQSKSSSQNTSTTVQFGDLLPNRDDRCGQSSDVDPIAKFSFDKQVDLSTHPGPSPSVLLQALTMSNANDGINLERLETIGDSFLKYAISVYLYCDYTTVHEGKLSYLRSKQVSNMNLFKLGKKKQLGEFMVAAKFEPSDNWLSPSYTVPAGPDPEYCDRNSNTVMEDLPSSISKDVDTLIEKSKPKPEVVVPYNLLTQHSIPDKSIADCVEALIGAYLTSCGTKGALLFMSWLGIKVLPKSEDDNSNKSEYTWLKPPPSPLITYITEPEEILKQLLSGYSDFEKLIGYTFKDRAYLLQAFTHASYHYNHLTDCYQRLEFLGDAVLDYLITRHLYEDPRQHCPGTLTDLRSALVNNTFFASLSVKYQFYKYFKAISPGLFEVINKFVQLKKSEADEISLSHHYLTEDECDTNEEEDIEVPKALGDIFESVAGAIYLDSGMSLDTVWRVYYAMMKPEIEQFSTNVPKSPIRELLEMEPETAKFWKPKKTILGKIRVVVEVYGKGKFVGVGRNYRIAKCTAAKRALNSLRKM